MRVRAFGIDLEVLRAEASWAIFDIGNEGKKRPARDIAIPPDIGEREGLIFIGDLLHEHASESYPDVILLN